MKIFIDFTKPDKHKKFPIFSWLIRLWQRTPYSHVRIRWINSAKQELIFEASGTKVKLIGEVAAKDIHNIVVKSYEVEASKAEYRNLIKLFKYSSVEYGMAQIVGIGLANWLGLKKNPLSQGRKSQVCSELLGLFMVNVKRWQVPINLDIAGPKEIDQALEKLIKDGVPGLKLV